MSAGRHEQGRTAAYRGADRRATPRLEVPYGPALVAAVLVAGLWLVLILATEQGAIPPWLDTDLLAALLDAASVTLALVAGAVCLLRARLSGETPPFYAGLALLLYGAVTLGGASLAPQVVGVARDTLNAPRAASWLVFVALLVWAMLAPHVDSAMRPLRAVTGLLAGVVALTGVFLIVPEAGAAFLGAADPAAEGAVLPGAAVRLGMWLVLAVALVLSGRRRERALFTWLGVGATGFALVEFSGVLLGGEAAATASVLQAGVLLAVLVGASLDLLLVYTAQRGSLFDTALTARTAEARLRADEARGRRRAHEALNALTAIQGASSTLERFQARLQPAERAELVRALGTEIGRLQHLVATRPEPDTVDSYSLAGQLGPVLADFRAEGALIDGELAAELRANGRWADTAEALRIVLAALRAHAPAAPLRIAAAEDDDAVILRVGEERGAGAPGGQQPIEELPGSSLDLRVAADLIRAQSGDLLVEQHEGSLAFVFRLPALAGE